MIGEIGDLDMRLAVAHPKIDLEGLSDEELVEIARQGGENAIRLLVKRNNRRLFRVARAIVRDDAEAEDIVQETYVSAFTKLVPGPFPVLDLTHPHRPQRGARTGAKATAFR
jgi:hypothetical protein